MHRSFKSINFANSSDPYQLLCQSRLTLLRLDRVLFLAQNFATDKAIVNQHFYFFIPDKIVQNVKLDFWSEH